jgi:hypothetical protein
VLCPAVGTSTTSIEIINMTCNPNYPETVVEVLDPPVRFRPSVILAVGRFASSKPYRGTDDDRKAKFASLHGDLCAVYEKGTRLVFGPLDGGDSGASHYSPVFDEVTLRGRLSVVTYLHEFAHALGRDERGAVRWSVNLYRACFPRSFARCVMVGHMLRRVAPPARARPPRQQDRCQGSSTIVHTPASPQATHQEQRP